MRPSYERHAGLVGPEDLRDPIVIIGCGAVGSWVTSLLARYGARHLQLWDGDRVEAHNLPNQYYDLKHIGQTKASSLAEAVQRFDREIRVEVNERYFTTSDVESVHGPMLLMVDTIDSSEKGTDGRREIVTALRGNLFPDHLFEARMGFGFGEINVVDLADPISVDRWLNELPQDPSAVPEGPCGLRTCPDMVTLISTLLVRQVIGMYAARRHNTEWSAERRFLLQIDPPLIHDLARKKREAIQHSGATP